jgi:hypothetical protein
MSHCQHEHTGGDDHHHHHHDHQHTHDEEDSLVKDLLYSQIDIDHVIGLNESQPGASATVIKPWHERYDLSKYVQSDVDEQLIIHIPFTGMIKLKSILLYTLPDDSAPSKLKV